MTRSESERHNQRVLIVGCGQLGSRHLQAVAALPQVREIEVVDPRPAALQLGRERLAEVPDRPAGSVVRWLSSLEEASVGGGVCIVATQAQVRCQVVQHVVEQLDYASLLLEKIVAQSIRDLDALSALAAARRLSVWVNLKTRAYPFHQRVRQRLGSAEPILFSVVGGNHGLANNGVHAADLFAFYDGARHIHSAGACIDPILHPSKRGRDVFDLSGTLQGVTDTGSHFMLSYASDHDGSEHIAITTRRYRCIVDHMQRWAVESDASSGGTWRSVPFEGNPLVSHMTKQFIADILATGRCALPTLEESLVAHRFILSELQPHFNRLLEREVPLCPVT